MADSDKEEILHDVKQAEATNGKSSQAEARAVEREGELAALSTPIEKAVKLSKRDQKLLEIFLIDVEAYFTALYNEFAKKLFQYLRKQASMQHSDSDIEDYVQITLTRFYLWALNHYQTAPETLQVNHNSYLHKIAMYVLFDEGQKRKRLSTHYMSEPIRNQGEDTTATLGDVIPDPHGLDEYEKKIFLDKVRDTIERLREPYRTVLQLRAQGWNDQETSEHLKRKLETVKSQVKRGRELLKDALPEYKDHL